MPNLDAPARLGFWPECHGEQGGDYDTLRQALAEAAPSFRRLTTSAEPNTL